MTPSSTTWPAVLSLSAGVFALVAAEFFPASLLTPMAQDLGVSAAAAGQTVTATAGVGLVAALTTAIITRRIDRRLVVLGLSALLVLSNLIVATAQGMETLLAGRLLLGAALGGFWALAPALIMRLASGPDTPRALSLLAAGVSAATILAAPVGASIAAAAGWRSVFFLGAGIGAATLLFQALALPNLPPQGRTSLAALTGVLRRRGVGAGLLAILLVVSGHFALFTYVRPFLETVSGADAMAVTLILLGFGVGNVVGNFVAGPLAARSLRLLLALAPLGIATIAIGLALFGGALAADGAAIALWGAMFGLAPVGWTVWVNRVTPDAAEAGSALVVAGFQAAITIGASAGGAVIALSGPAGLYLVAGMAPALAAVVILGAVRPPALSPTGAMEEGA